MVSTKMAEYTNLGDVVEFPAGIFMTIWLLSTFLSFFFLIGLFFGLDTIVIFNDIPGMIDVRAVVFPSLYSTVRFKISFNRLHLP